MRGQKKHPLEIFRSSGRRLGADAATPRETTSTSTPEPPKSEPAPSEEFQLLLNLNGGLILLFAWVVLMGAAYLYGYNRGAASERGGRDEAALAKGDEIAEGTSAPEATDRSSTSTEARRPYGVLLVTYRKSAWSEQFVELRRTLREKYGVTDLVSWERDPEVDDPQVEVMAGAFASKDDPRLAELAGTIRKISDWPHGKNKRPFASAFVKMHPYDPARASRATNGE